MVSKRQRGYMKILDFTCQMYKNGTPELAGTFPFASSKTSYAGGVQKLPATGSLASLWSARSTITTR